MFHVYLWSTFVRLPMIRTHTHSFVCSFVRWFIHSLLTLWLCPFIVYSSRSLYTITTTTTTVISISIAPRLSWLNVSQKKKKKKILWQISYMDYNNKHTKQKYIFWNRKENNTKQNKASWGKLFCKLTLVKSNF